MFGLFDKPKGKPHLEIQIHPSDIRRGVWYLFATERQIWGWTAAGVAFLLFLLLSAALAPRVIADRLRLEEYEAMVAQRARQGERLEGLTAELAELGKATDDVHLRMSRIYVAYGLRGDESVGQGGFPKVPEAAPESIYAAKIRHGAELQAGIHEQMEVLAAFIAEVQAFEQAHQGQARTTPSINPLRGSDFVLTSPFGTRRSPFTKEIDFHPGIDLAAPTGLEIRAPADGTVVFAGRYPLKQSVAWWRYGNMVSIRHGDRFITIFGHCDEVRVRSGETVDQGQVIGTVGNTGWSTSSHLHYEVRRLDDEGAFKAVDPRIYILDHRWRDEERLLVRARHAPDSQSVEPLPRLIARN